MNKKSSSGMHPYITIIYALFLSFVWPCNVEGIDPDDAITCRYCRSGAGHDSSGNNFNLNINTFDEGIVHMDDSPYSNGGSLRFNRNGCVWTTHTFNAAKNITNNFTMECWVKPQEDHEIDVEGNISDGRSGQKFAIEPLWGTTLYSEDHAGTGFSVGKNGVSVYERATADCAIPVLVWEATPAERLNDWTHITVVYENRIPKLYVNGVLKKTGVAGTEPYVHPATVRFGGDIYHDAGYKGSLGDVRFSDGIIYHANFDRPTTPLSRDPNSTFGLWHLGTK